MGGFRSICVCIAAGACASPPTATPPVAAAPAYAWPVGEVIEVWGFHASNWEYAGFYPDGGREPWYARGGEMPKADSAVAPAATCGERAPQARRVRLQGVLTVPGGYGHLNRFERMFVVLRVTGGEKVDCTAFVERYAVDPMF